MNITITTAIITIGEKEIPLTKAIVNQLERMPGVLPKGWDSSNVQLLGHVEMTDAIYYLYSTPDGVHRSITSFERFTAFPNTSKRIVLIK